MGVLATLHEVRKTLLFADRAEVVAGKIVVCGKERRYHWAPLGRRIERTESYVYYQYFVNGVEFEGAMVSHSKLPRFCSSNQEAYQLRGLREGQAVKVWVDPEFPARAYLDVRIDPWVTASWLVLAATVMAVGVASAQLPRRGVDATAARMLGTFGIGVGLSLVLVGARKVVFGDPASVLVLGGVVFSMTLLALLPRREPAQLFTPRRTEISGQ